MITRRRSHAISNEQGLSSKRLEQSTGLVLAPETPCVTPVCLESTKATTIRESPECLSLDLSHSSDDSLTDVCLADRKDIYDILENEFHTTSSKTNAEATLETTSVSDDIAGQLATINLKQSSETQRRLGERKKCVADSGIENESSTLYLNEDLELTGIACAETSVVASSPSSTKPISTLILDGVVVYVQVRSEYEDRSEAIGDWAKSLGAQVSKNFTKAVTHVIFRNGTQKLYKSAEKRGVHLVSTLWLNCCAEKGRRVAETDYPATKPQPNTLPTSKPKRFRNMQPRTCEENERAAMARIKKRRRIAFTAENAPTEQQLQTPLTQLCHRESPGTPRDRLMNLLSPYLRKRYSSDGMTEPSDDELNTPLATRLYRKYFSPLHQCDLSDQSKNYLQNTHCNPQITSAHQTNGSQPMDVSDSTTVSQFGRRHKLHVVEALPEELIVPSSPLSASKPNVYSQLQMQPTKTQRQAFALRKDMSYMPLPRARTIPSTSAMLAECEQKHRNGDSIVSSHCSSKRGRFSLIGVEQRSPNEFVEEGLERRKRSHRQKSMWDVRRVCLSSFHSKEIGSVVSILEALGKYELVSEVCATTTHVVCASERRTINVLRGIAHGIWVVCVSWLYESVELNAWAPEEPFELFNFCPGAKIARIAKLTDGVVAPDLFREFGRIYIEASCSPPRPILGELLRRCKANQTFSVKTADVAIGVGKAQHAGLVRVTEKWVLDSIQLWQPQPLFSYLIS